MVSGNMGAGSAFPARGVDLADDPAADPAGFGRGNNLADEFVAERAAIVHIAAGDLQIRVTNAGEPDLNKRLARRDVRLGCAFVQSWLTVIDDCPHPFLR